MREVWSKCRQFSRFGTYFTEQFLRWLFCTSANQNRTDFRTVLRGISEPNGFLNNGIPDHRSIESSTTTSTSTANLIFNYFHSSASAKSLFLALKRIKTCLRSSQSQIIFPELALISAACVTNSTRRAPRFI